MHLICRRYNNILHFSKPKRVTKKYRKDTRALSDWFYANKLSLNVQKTNFVAFAPKNTNNNTTSITLGNQQILRINNAKLLGIYIDDGFEWEYNINHIVKQLSGGSYAIHTVKKYFRRNQSQICAVLDTMYRLLHFLSSSVLPN